MLSKEQIQVIREGVMAKRPGLASVLVRRAKPKRPWCKGCNSHRASLEHELCSFCLFKIDAADTISESVEGIRQDMRSANIGMLTGVGI